MRSPSGADGDRLVLIGTVHRTGTGAAVLRRLLTTLCPGTVTLEMSPYGLDYRLTRAPILQQRLLAILTLLAAESGRSAAELQSHPEVAGIRDLLALPFEYRAATEYAQETGAVVALIDLSEISIRKLQRVEEELVTEENLRVLLSLPESPGTAEGYAVARALVLGNRGEAVRQSFLAGRRGEEGIGRRDRHMTAEIRRLLGECPGRLVHVGGWVHLVEDREGETLYSLLVDLGPLRAILEP